MYIFHRRRRGDNGRQKDVEITRERKKYRAPPLPKRRPRTLTISSDWDAQAEHRFPSGIHALLGRKFWIPQSTSNQDHSPLFARLPAEIRSMIWEHLLCGLRLHIVRARKRLLAIRCDKVPVFEPDLHECRHSCWAITTTSRLVYTPTSGHYLGPVDGEECEYANLVPILKTCRLMYAGPMDGNRNWHDAADQLSRYSETVDLIYRKNMFDIDNLDTIISLSRTVMFSRLNLIRVLRLQYSFRFYIWSLYDPSAKDKDPAPYNAKTWIEACNVLAGLIGLEELYMHLGGYLPFDDPSGSWTPKLAEPLFKPLIQVRQTRIFDISVPWAEDTELKRKYEIEGAPFRLISRTPCYGRDWYAT